LLDAELVRLNCQSNELGDPAHRLAVRVVAAKDPV